MHTASLCHDDVIDGGEVRRSGAALWRHVGVTSAVLLGDALLCESVDVVAGVASGIHTRDFLAAVREVLISEAEQELLSRDARPDEETCLRLARGKTGPLFAFTAGLCGGRDPRLTKALREAGYRIGTAYQLIDDLLDITGDPHRCGKTLGTDARRGTPTLAQMAENPASIIPESVRAICESVDELLRPWPAARLGYRAFMEKDLERCLREQGIELGLLQPAPRAAVTDFTAAAGGLA